MKRMVLHVLVVTLLASWPVFAQTPAVPGRFPVEFVKGDFPIKECLGSSRRMCRGFLVLENDQLRFVNGNKRQDVEFAVPLSAVTRVTNTIERGGPSAGAVLAFGVFGLASRTRDEFIFITTETESTASVLTFRVPRDTSPDTIAKIEFAVRKYHEAQQ